MASKTYNDLSKEELVRLLEARDRQGKTRFGLVWEANEIERDRALNSDFVALDLVPDQCCGEAPWRNLIIEGDNFDALRYLRMAYAGRVKCIYIDPPYNTGNRDFVYNDRFVDKEDQWRHSKWCEFMNQRLMLARDLLAQDGAIFISIDDNEIFHLGCLMDRIFGPDNMSAVFVWRKVDSPNDNKVPITPDHEFILCYSRKQGSTNFAQMSAPSILDAYGKTDDSGRRFRDRLLKKNGKNSLRRDRPSMYFGIRDPDGNEVYPIHDNGEEARWAMGKKSVDMHLANGTLVWKKRDKRGATIWEPYTREFAPEIPTRPYPTIWSDLPTSRQAKAMLREVFGTADLFSTPKPIELIERILHLSNDSDCIVLDFFAGSGSTAHAVLKRNAEDGGNRRFILVSNTEATEDEPEKNLCRDVCAKRVRRVIEGYGEAKGVPGDFAYLRCRRLPQDRLTRIQHEQVWLALQMMHRETFFPFRRGPFCWSGDATSALMYVPRFREEDMKAVRKQARQSGAVLLYSWEPSLFARHLRSKHIQLEPIPESLARRFGQKG
jgi:adenine-specific DNA-methyltransferase